MSDLPFSLSMMVRDAASMLRRMLPTFASCFPEKLALVSDSTDDTERVMREHGFTVVKCEWPDNFSVARNWMLAWLRERSKLPWTLMMDADESVFPGDVSGLADLALHPDTQPVVSLPRYNFGNVGETTFDETLKSKTMVWYTKLYPDLQSRLMRLDFPLEFRNLRHHLLWQSGATDAWMEKRGQFTTAKAHIYHYGWCYPWTELARKLHRQNCFDCGAPSGVDHFDPTTVKPQPPDHCGMKRFDLPHPLDA